MPYELHGLLIYIYKKKEIAQKQIRLFPLKRRHLQRQPVSISIFFPELLKERAKCIVTAAMHHAFILAAGFPRILVVQIENRI